MRKFMFLVLLGLLPMVTVHAEDAVVAVGKKVSFEYTLTVDNEQVESSVGQAPLSYNHGRGEIVPGLEQALEGLKAGDSKTVVVKPADGYGEVRTDAFRDFESSKLPADLVPAVGMVLEMQDDTGAAYPAVISEVKEKAVTLNFNHPLAGKELTFDVKIVAVE